MKYFNSLLTLVALLSIAPVSTSSAANAIERVTNRYALNPDGRVQLENFNGRVVVRAWDGAGVTLEAIKEGRTAEVVAGIKINVQSTPELLKVKTELAKVKRGWFGSTHEGQVSYTLLAPAGAKLDGIESVNGEVAVEGMRGPIKVSTVNGNINIHGLAGAARISTVNGRIVTEHATLKAGDHLKASAVNGRIEVRIPAGAGASLTAETVNGTIHSDFAYTSTGKISRRSVAARIGDGGAQLDLETVNGSIRIRTARDEQAAAK